MGVGERIKQRRKELGISQDELAKRMGYTSRSTIAKIESGANDVTQSNIVKFADVLNTSIAFLMDWNDSDESASEIGLSIKNLRLMKNMNLIELAHELGIDPTLMKEYESGERRIPFALLERIAKYFGISADELTHAYMPSEISSTAFISTNERQTELHRIWAEQVGYIEWTDEEHQLLVKFANYIKSIKDRDDYEMLFAMLKGYIDSINSSIK